MVGSYLYSCVTVILTTNGLHAILRKLSFCPSDNVSRPKFANKKMEM